MPDTKKQIQQMIEYVSSPLYLKRLIDRGIDNPKEVVRQRIKNLQNTKFEKGKQAATRQDPNTSYPVVALSREDDEGVSAHEIGHAAGGNVFPAYQSNYNRTTGPLQAGGLNLSAAENFDFYGANKSLKAGMPGNKLLVAVTEDYSRASARELQHRKDIEKQKRETGSAYDTGIAPELQINPNPMVNYEAANIGELAPMKWDPHQIGSGEGYGDLTALRFLLKKHGITQNLGDNITKQMLDKALKDPKISKDFHMKRMRDNYSDDDIIKLNNTIAYNKNKNSNYA